jgi:hypothetical protein
MKIDPKTRRVLEETGLPWELENGKKHTKIWLAGQFVGILPQNGRIVEGAAHKNVVAQIRRAAKEITNG